MEWLIHGSAVEEQENDVLSLDELNRKSEDLAFFVYFNKDHLGRFCSRVAAFILTRYVVLHRLLWNKIRALQQTIRNCEGQVQALLAERRELYDQINWLQDCFANRDCEQYQ